MNLTACGYCDYLECRCDGLDAPHPAICVCDDCRDAEEAAAELDFASMHEEGHPMSRDGIIRRCVECSFVMFEEEPYVVGEWGYYHPRCTPEEFL